jgi:uncharacterized protein YegJ (DUF2314 family)
VERTDPEMIAAMLKARDRVGEFIEALKKPRRGQSFAVKARFEDGEEIEYLWLSPVRYDGKTFTGKIVNEPERVGTVQYGAEHSVQPSEIADWAITEGGKTTGAFTDQVARKRTSR